MRWKGESVRGGRRRGNGIKRWPKRGNRRSEKLNGGGMKERVEIGKEQSKTDYCPSGKKLMQIVQEPPPVANWIAGAEKIKTPTIY